MKNITDFVDNPYKKTIADVFVFMLNQRESYPCTSDYFRCDLDGYGSCSDKIDFNIVNSENLMAMAHNRAIMTVLKAGLPYYYNAVINHWDKTGHDYFSREFGASKEDFQELFKQYNLPE